MVWQGFSNKTFGSVRKGAASLGMVRFGKVLLEKVCCMEWYGQARSDLVMPGRVRYGMVY